LLLLLLSTHKPHCAVQWPAVGSWYPLLLQLADGVGDLSGKLLPVWSPRRPHATITVIGCSRTVFIPVFILGLLFSAGPAFFFVFTFLVNLTAWCVWVSVCNAEDVRSMICAEPLPTCAFKLLNVEYAVEVAVHQLYTNFHSIWQTLSSPLDALLPSALLLPSHTNSSAEGQQASLPGIACCCPSFLVDTSMLLSAKTHVHAVRL
jgi:hypothetical protein